MSDVKITDLDYRWISNEVYKVRKNKPGIDYPLKKGDDFEKSNNKSK